MTKLGILGSLICLGCATAENEPPPPLVDSAALGQPVSPQAAMDSTPLPLGTDWARNLDSLAPNPFPTPSATWVARFDGVGPVVIGLSVAEATARYGPGYAPPEDTEGCDYVSIPGGPPGVLVMVEQNRLVRVDVDDARVATDRGIRIGDTEADVRRAYDGLVRQESHPYSGPEWHYLIVTPRGDAAHQIIFETNGWRVMSYRVGLAEQVAYIEGCS